MKEKIIEKIEITYRCYGLIESKRGSLRVALECLNRDVTGLLDFDCIDSDLYLKTVHYLAELIVCYDNVEEFNKLYELRHDRLV